MCFITLKDEQPKIAEEDIVCYKITAGDLFPCYYRFYGGKEKPPYQLNKEYSATNKRGNRIRKLILRKDKFSRYYIFEGIHSYNNLGIHSYNNFAYADYSLGLLNNSAKILRCVIPKGTKYYENGEEYVSLKIIPKEIIE